MSGTDLKLAEFLVTRGDDLASGRFRDDRGALLAAAARRLPGGGDAD